MTDAFPPIDDPRRSCGEPCNAAAVTGSGMWTAVEDVADLDTCSTGASIPVSAGSQAVRIELDIDGNPLGTSFHDGFLRVTFVPSA